MSSPYRASLPEPVVKPRALLVLTKREGMARISASLSRFSLDMDLISAREIAAFNERRFERRMARIKSGLAY